MSWEDPDFGIEFIKFATTTLLDCVDASPNKSVIYIEPHYHTIVDYQNQWNKKRKRIRVSQIGRDYISDLYDTINDYDNLWLDMGARLFNTIKKFAESEETYLKVIKSVNPLNKFDTWYFAEPYKMHIQKVIPSKSKKSKK